MYRNLEAEMIRSSISSEMVADTIGKTYSTTRAKIAGRQPLTLSEAKVIRNTYFQKLPLDYLFFEENDPSENEV